MTEEWDAAAWAGMASGLGLHFAAALYDEEPEPRMPAQEDLCALSREQRLLIASEVLPRLRAILGPDDDWRLVADVLESLALRDEDAG